MSTDKRIPDDFSEYPETIMSNYGHEINQEVVTAIKGEKYWSHYPAWDFSGNVWYQAGAWHCEIWCYHSYRETISADSPESLMKACSDKYGHK